MRHTFASVVELVDTPDLGSGAARCESSSLSARTIYKKGATTVGCPFLFLPAVSLSGCSYSVVASPVVAVSAELSASSPFGLLG